MTIGDRLLMAVVILKVEFVSVIVKVSRGGAISNPIRVILYWFSLESLDTWKAKENYGNLEHRKIFFFICFVFVFFRLGLLLTRLHFRLYRLPLRGSGRQ